MTIKMKERVKKWLQEEEIFKEETKDENAVFHFVVNYPAGRGMEIIQPKNKRDAIVVASPTTISPEHVDVFNRMSPERRKEFLYQLRSLFTYLQVDFQMQHPENILRQYILTDIIFEDALTKNRLIASIRRLWRANLHGIWEIQNESSTPETPKSATGSEMTMYA